MQNLGVLDWDNPFKVNRSEVEKEVTRTCAICGKGIFSRDICNKCYKEFSINGILPTWVEDICKTQHSFECNPANQEICFSDLESINMDGDNEFDEDEYGDDVNLD
jgi:hypothetical protein